MNIKQIALKYKARRVVVKQCIFIAVIKFVKKAVVIGSGVAGLASSIRLAIQGYDVSVFETHDSPGGKLGSSLQNGFRFDLGPSLFTMPGLVEELFELCGEKASDHFKYVNHPTSCTYYWNDGIQLAFHSDNKKLAEEIESKLQVDSKHILSYLANARTIHDRIGSIFLGRSLHKFNSWFKRDVAKALLHLPSYKLNSTMHKVHARSLNHPKLIQIADRYATYNGSDPYRAPAVLRMIPHFEHNLGTHFPVDGIYSITLALYELAKRQGVKFHFNTKVDKITTAGNKVIGVECNEERIPADVVVSNMDVYYTYKHLLERPTQVKRLQQERSSSAVIFYWGMNHDSAGLDLHNIFFSDNYKEEFEALFESEAPITDPTIYLHIGSLIAKNDAPAGKSTWFVMINAPADNGQDWNEIVNQLRSYVTTKLTELTSIPVSDLIEVENVYTPADIDRKTWSYKGSLYGTASNSKFAAFNRHPNFDKELKNLYYCGGSVHPGGGIPLCLKSAEIVRDLVGPR